MAPPQCTAAIIISATAHCTNRITQHIPRPLRSTDAPVPLLRCLAFYALTALIIIFCRQKACTLCDGCAAVPDILMLPAITAGNTCGRATPLALYV